jgi:hypothetical protein
MTEETHPTMTLVYVVLGVVVLLILLLILNGIKGTFKGVDSRVCKESVEAHMIARASRLKPYDDIRCPPKEKKITEAKEYDIMKKTSDEMADCFWKFGENGILFEDDGVYCALCSHVIYEGSAKGKKIDGFRQFLEKEPVPPKYSTIGSSYSKYIISQATDPAQVSSVALPDNIPLDTSIDYGVMFVYTKNQHMGKALAAIVGGTSGAIVTAAGGLIAFPGSWAAAGVIAVVSAGVGVGSATVGGVLGSERVADRQSAVLLVPWNEAELKKLPCTQMPVDWANK